MAHPRTLLNIGLLVLVGALAALAFWEPGKAPPPGSEPLTGRDAESIDSLSIERSGAPTLRAERDAAGRWHLTTPLAVAANDVRLQRVARVAEAKSLGSFPAEGDLAPYGLDAPRARLTVDGDLSLEFGASTPVDQRRYVRLGDRIHLVGDTHLHHLIGGVETFVSLRLLPEGAGIERLTLPGLELSQEGGRWRATPADAARSADTVAALVENWRQARAMEVTRAPAEVAGEQVRLTLAGEDEPLVFVVTARGPDTELVRPDLGLAYRLPRAVAAGLFSPQTE